MVCVCVCVWRVGVWKCAFCLMFLLFWATPNCRSPLWAAPKSHDHTYIHTYAAFPSPNPFPADWQFQTDSHFIRFLSFGYIYIYICIYTDVCMCIHLFVYTCFCCSGCCLVLNYVCAHRIVSQITWLLSAPVWALLRLQSVLQQTKHLHGRWLRQDCHRGESISSS